MSSETALLGERKGWAKISSELAQDRRAWGASIRGVVSPLGDAGSTRQGECRAQMQVQRILFGAS